MAGTSAWLKPMWPAVEQHRVYLKNIYGIDGICTGALNLCQYNNITDLRTINVRSEHCRSGEIRWVRLSLPFARIQAIIGN